MAEKLKNCPYCTSPREPWEINEDTGVKIIDCRDGKFYLQMYSPGIRIELQINHCPNCGGLLQHSTRAADETTIEEIEEFLNNPDARQEWHEYAQYLLKRKRQERK